jgi:geranylgeranyl diphosphate synthase type I
MMDLQLGAGQEFPSEQEILRLYTWKTARYSFSLPLSAGALLAGCSESQVKALERVGELAGLAFQMRDDELGLFGNPEETGKVKGSDLREGKKTLLLALALQKLDGAARAELLSLVGKREASQAELARGSDLVDHSGARQLLHERMGNAISEAKALLDSLACPNKDALLAFKQILDFCRERKR